MIAGYEVEVERLTARLGGGYVAYAPELKGCLADGATREEALHRLADAIECWLLAAKVKGRTTSAADKPRVLLDVS